MKTKFSTAVVFTSAIGLLIGFNPFGTSYIALGQNTGINANGAAPNVSAMLDVDVSSLAANNKKGMLIPRVALVSSTDAVTIPTPATSLLVYSDGTGGLSPAGYFYNSGTPGSPVWVQLLNGGTSFCGSAATNYVTKFTSASAICNSIIYDNGTNVGIGITTPQARLDVIGNIKLSTAGAINGQGTYLNWNDNTISTLNGLALDQGASHFINHRGTGLGGFSFDMFNNANAFIFTPMYITGNGYVGIGTTTPATILEVVETSVSSVRGITSTQYGNNSIGGRIVARKARGTLAGPLATSIGDNEGLLIFQGFDGTSFGDGVSVEAKATENWTATAHGSSLYFTTVANGTTSRNVWMTIDNTGNVGIGTPTPSYKLDISVGDGDGMRINSTLHATFDANSYENVLRPLSANNVQGSNKPNATTFLQGLSAGCDYGSFQILANASNSDPLIYWRTEINNTGVWNPWLQMVAYNSSGNVGIATTAPVYTLDVCGDIRATGSVYYGGTCGTANGTLYTKPDYVFESGYRSFSPDEVEKFIIKQGHLPWLTSSKKEKQENKDAVNITRMSFETLEAVENMQMQIIELAKQNEAQQKLIAEMQKEMEKLEKQ